MSLGPGELERLTASAQYLNLQEMKEFCEAHDLSLYIYIRRPDGRLKRTTNRDRKDVVLKRILDFAVKGERTGPTIYAASVVADAPLPAELTPRTRLRYGQYEKHNPDFVATMVDLTGGAFRSGMIARLVLRDFWTAGTAPTLRQFADAWIRATQQHTKPRPEGAYLSDLWKGEAGPEWKGHRKEQARHSLRRLGELVEARAGTR